MSLSPLNKKLLLIDGENSFANRLKSALSSRYSVDIFIFSLGESVESVLRLASHTCFLALILEINLGEKGERLKRKGVEIVKGLRCAIQSPLSLTPIILTSFEEKDELLKTPECAIVDADGCYFLSNPISFKELEDTLQTVKRLSFVQRDAVVKAYCTDLLRKAIKDFHHDLRNLGIQSLFFEKFISNPSECNLERVQRRVAQLKQNVPKIKNCLSRFIEAVAKSGCQGLVEEEIGTIYNSINDIKTGLCRFIQSTSRESFQTHANQILCGLRTLNRAPELLDSKTK
ncbi:TPA: hypothetical protein EYP66_16350 [Candidatus Poribacteria bacterium]|nr:hypothetical protein [Candidatus Poribacteria bacterium]